ncbi:succinate dehydrogenase assembly factor 2, mitochondrial [Mercurialis annua]|uniref:succinate dehydrogenase assembly factor 2, mitochondrial n=1 Tax=Mercurialis annua TaxID=3986 RepID=UPI00215DE637|nr:succinate dehydrogenase assembly factor 2, mitochondrial [Mercurialis annua]XP_055960923.1 succinate dehydrogenase assembly factor 2, mitochondrial [Mercurialis annua]
MASLRRALINAHRLLNSSATPCRSSITSSSPIRIQSPFRSEYGWISRYSTVSDNDTIDLSNEENKRRLCNRLLYRSKQRGFLELDLVLGKWVEEHIESMDEHGVKALIHVLDVENPDLWKWLTGQEQPPEALNMNPVFSAVRDKVMNNLNNHTSPETRAIPGQPWVRGWDDIKKYPGNPVAGNQ